MNDEKKKAMTDLAKAFGLADHEPTEAEAKEFERVMRASRTRRAVNASQAPANASPITGATAKF